MINHNNSIADEKVKEDDPYVSIIIPCYCAENTVIRAVDSALAQVGVQKQVIVVDDKSTDNSLELLLEAYETDSRVEIIPCKKNAGPSVARNIALSAAKGDWIAVLDADDFMHKSRIKKLIDFARLSGSAFVADSYYVCDEISLQPYNLRQKRSGSGKITPKNLIDDNIGSCKPLFSKAVIESGMLFYRDVIRYGEDLELLVRLLFSGYSCSFINTPLYYKVESRNSLTSRRVKLLSAIIPLYENMAEKYCTDDEIFCKSLHQMIGFQKDALTFHLIKDEILKNHLSSSFMIALRHSNLLRAIKHLMFRKKRFYNAW